MPDIIHSMVYYFLRIASLENWRTIIVLAPQIYPSNQFHKVVCWQWKGGRKKDSDD